MAESKITHERAYVLGLLVAAGTLSPNAFSMYLPFDQWGTSAAILNEIMTSLLTTTRETFKSAYGIEIEPKIGGKKNTWVITPRVLPGGKEAVTKAIEEIKSDLQHLGLPTKGVLLKTSDLSSVKKELPKSVAARFLTGIFDARASLTLSHRRNHSDNPMVSVELPASTPVTLVVQLCTWMTDLGSVTDQILYNHPSFHSGTDSQYKSWKKGYKIRVSASSFFAVHKFGISPKSVDVKKLAGKQNVQVQPACSEREPRLQTRCIHSDLLSTSLKPPMRGSVYLHFLQACADLGCPHAPVNAVRATVQTYQSRVAALSLCTKGTIQEIKTLFYQCSSQYFADLKVSQVELPVSQVVDRLQSSGYVELEDGMKFLVADRLKGKRALGNGAEVISKAADMEVSLFCIESENRNFQAPVMLVRKDLDRAVFLSSTTGMANRDLLSDMVGIQGLAIRLRST